MSGVGLEIKEKMRTVTLKAWSSVFQGTETAPSLLSLEMADVGTSCV